MNSKTRSETKNALGERVRTCAIAMAISLVAAGSAPAAVSFPPYPLLTGGDSIPPNIMMILDDSGSMAFEYMPDDECEYLDAGCPVGGNRPNRVGKWITSTVNVARRAYTRNTLYYNPAVTYRPWLNANGTSRMTGGTSYSAAYASFNLVGGGTIDLGDSTSCRRFNYNNGSGNSPSTDEPNSGGREVCGGEQVFFVPKNRTDTTAAYVANGNNYEFYKILAGGSDIVSTTTYGNVTSTVSNAAGFPKTGLSATKNNWLYYQVVVPAGATKLEVTTSGGSGDADLYVRYGSSPATNSYDCGKTSNGNSETCSFDSPRAGTYYIGAFAYSTFSGMTMNVKVTTTNRCGVGTDSKDWINCSSALPGSRTLPDELSNYATWYSYHRTRNKIAKGGASEAFGGLEKNYRIGFDTIWNRGGGTPSVTGNTPAYPIPTSRNNGLFEDKTGANNRGDFFGRLQSVVAYNGTPLHGALQRAGRYYSRSDADSPWRDGSGNELSCRQNYALLATDGYWNNADDSGGYSPAVKNADSGSKYSDSFSNTLADVAYYYWKNDLRTDTNMPNNVRPSSLDEATWQHMVTFGISIGAQGTLDPSKPAPSVWPDPTITEDARRIDDLWHASLNGRGAFVVASDTEKFAAALKSALQSIDARTASGSNIASSSTKTESSTLTFVAGFTSVSWIGDLKASPFNAGLTGVSDTPLWQLSQTFSAGGVNADAFASRTVLTSMNGTPALFNSALPNTTIFERSGGSDPVTASENIAYLRGDQSKEKSKKDGVLRTRTYPIGDIVDSSPAYVDDTKSVFVGANDGMMHGINGVTGKVLFSYVPKGLDFTSLATLSSQTYEHRYFVDGQIDVISRANQGNGKNILVGALGRGGRGVFALDVTNPGSMGVSNVLWDRTFQTPAKAGDPDPDADMGYVLGAVRIRKGNGDKTYALVPNGIDSANGSATLYAYELSATGSINKTHTLVAPGGSGNGLMSTGMADLNGDGKIDVVYGADLKGNIWRWDFSGVSPAALPVRIFQALDADNKPQAITGGLGVGRDTSGRIFIGFGTGRFISNSDVPTSAADLTQPVQSIYGIIDSGTTIAGRDNLQVRTIPYSGKTSDGKVARGFEGYKALPADKQGWYIDLPRPERVTSAPTIYGSAMYIASQIPPNGADCTGASGSGFVNAMNLFTGTSPKSGGYFNDQTDLAGGVIGSIGVTGGMPTEVNLTTALVTWGTGGGLDTGSGGVPPPTGGQPRRVSWREIVPE